MMDQAALDALPLSQKLNLCRQIREEQVRKYNEWSEEDGRSLYDNPKKEKRKNSKGVCVDFAPQFKLWDSIGSYDDRDGKNKL